MAASGRKTFTLFPKDSALFIFKLMQSTAAEITVEQFSMAKKGTSRRWRQIKRGKVRLSTADEMVLSRGNDLD